MCSASDNDPMMTSEAGSCPLFLTQGEPAGIGPELAMMLWQQKRELSTPAFCYVGSFDHLRRLDPTMPLKPILTPLEAFSCFDDAMPIFDVPLNEAVVLGRPSAATASQVLDCIQQAVEAAKQLGGAVITGPIQKATLYEAAFNYQGHTDYLAFLAGLSEDETVMMLANDYVRAVPLTVHIPLQMVSAALSTEMIVKKLMIVNNALQNQFGITAPKIAVSGLNPHAGEGGKLGGEENNIIIPALENLRAAGVDVDGPIPADSLFAKNMRENYDAHIAMYHDQALAPMKALDFENGVNITLGLPFVRTSPDHGTALSLAGTFSASVSSTLAALKQAQAMINAQKAGGQNG